MCEKEGLFTYNFGQINNKPQQDDIKHHDNMMILSVHAYNNSHIKTYIELLNWL